MTSVLAPLRAVRFALLASVLAPLPARADAIEACMADYEGAQNLRQEGKLRAARDALIRCSQTACPAAARTDCLTWLREVEASTPTVIVAVTDAASGLDITDVRVTVDGAEVRADGKAFAVDPGPHRFDFTAPGRRGAVMNVIVREAEKNRRIDARLESATRSEEAPPAARGAPLGGWVAAGVAVVGAVGFAIFGSWALVERNDLRDSCYPSCMHDDVQSVRTHAAIADVSLVVGVVASGVAAFLFLSPRSRAEAR